MVQYCCCYGCNEKYVKGGPVTFHSFPKDESRVKMWLHNIKRKNFIPTKYSKVCSKHFAEKCFDRERFGPTWLKSDAVPTIFNFPEHILPKGKSRKLPVKRDLFDYVQSSDHDHTYCQPSHLFHPETLHARNSSERVSGWLCHLAESTGEEQAEAATCCDKIDIKDEPIFTDDDSQPLQEFEQIYIKEESFDLEYKSDLTISGSKQESSPVEGNHSTSHIGTLPIRDDPEVGTGGHSPISCSVCHKTFKWRYRLKQHLRLHTGERPYSCGVCSKTFKQSGSLNKHLLLHMGNDLKKHSLQHTGERRYTCDVCSKTFTSSSNLKDHIQTHTGEKPYSCDLCHKTFRTSSVLRRHSLLHTDSAM